MTEAGKTLAEQKAIHDKQIRELQIAAKEKQIFWKSWRIAKELGKKNEEIIEGDKCLTYTFNASSSVVIKQIENTTPYTSPSVVITNKGKEVFSGAEGRTNDNTSHYVNGYIPGKWEAAIETHFRAAEQRENRRYAARNREYLKKEAAKEKARCDKWGIK